LVVVLDGVQDPGNAGTIVRSAEAFGAGGIVLLEGSVRVANGKFLRAAAGSIFRLPFLEAVERVEFIKRARSLGLTLYALAARGETSLQEADLRIPCALVVGGEGSGVSPELLAAGTVLSIPARKVESLNAAVAASIALFEAARQRERA
jgi:TrmH family RNA methyltransferase